jgi:adenosylmethionine-8-amino-7-oxononanoate aminotransferase
VREICDRHDVLLIADEVITGFGRTGRWFALEHWGVQPDLMTVAKAITSAYVPLAGFFFSRRVHEAFMTAAEGKKFMHGYTNAGHPTACAVALRNLKIMEDESLIEHAAGLGDRLLRGLESLRSLSHVGDVRGLGLLAGVELVADRSSRDPFPAAAKVGPRLLAELRRRGVITRIKGDSLLFAPPLVTEPELIDRLVEATGDSIRAVVGV